MAGWVTDGGLGRITAPLEQNQIGRGQNWLKCFSAICQWRGETDWSTSASLLQFSYCPSSTCRDAEPPLLSLCHEHGSHAMTPWCAILILQLDVNGQHWCFQNTSFNFSSPISSCICETWVGCSSAGSEYGLKTKHRTEHLLHKHTALLKSDISVSQKGSCGSVRVPGCIIINYVTGCFCYLNVYSKNMRRRVTFLCKENTINNLGISE